MIDVDATGISLLDLGKAELMLERGRQAAKSKLGDIEAAITRRTAETDPSQRGSS